MLSVCTKLRNGNDINQSEKNLRPYIKSTVENRSRVLVLHPHGVTGNVIETDRTVPGGNQQELGCAGAELDSRDAVLRPLIQLVLV